MKYAPFYFAVKKTYINFAIGIFQHNQIPVDGDTSTKFT